MNENTKTLLKSPAFTAPALMIFIFAVMQISGYAIKNLSAETNVYAAIGVIQLIVIGLPCLIYYLAKGKKFDSEMYIVSKKGVKILFLIFAAMLFISGMLLIKFVYFVRGGTVASLVNFYDAFEGDAEAANNFEKIISLIIIPAVCEEFLFRGILFSEYRRYGTGNTIIITSLCFAMMHFSVENFFIYLFTGILLGFVTAVSRSIIPATVLHLMSNALSIYASDRFLRVTVVKNGTYFIGFVLIVLTGVSLMLMLSRVENICYDYSDDPPTETLPPKSAEHWAKVFLSPTFLLLLVGFLCFIFLM